jgi:hypothetical protein
MIVVVNLRQTISTFVDVTMYPLYNYYRLIKNSTLKKHKSRREPSVMAYTRHPSTQGAEAEGSQVRGQPGLYSETLSQKKKRTEMRGSV